ncbi:MAG TPA: putative quinol monooxygenase [Anaerolineales bacterium]|jgi:autoinducer 2-degrading protein
MLVQVVYLQVQPALLDAFILEAAGNCAASAQEPGVLQFDLLQQTDDPLKFILYEVYDSTQALENHRLTAHYKRWAEVGVPMLSAERVRVLYNKVPVP